MLYRESLLWARLLLYTAPQPRPSHSANDATVPRLGDSGYRWQAWWTGTISLIPRCQARWYTTF